MAPPPSTSFASSTESAPRSPPSTSPASAPLARSPLRMEPSGVELIPRSQERNTLMALPPPLSPAERTGSATCSPPRPSAALVFDPRHGRPARQDRRAGLCLCDGDDHRAARAAEGPQPLSRACPPASSCSRKPPSLRRQHAEMGVALAQRLDETYYQAARGGGSLLTPPRRRPNDPNSKLRQTARRDFLAQLAAFTASPPSTPYPVTNISPVEDATMPEIITKL